MVQTGLGERKNEKVAVDTVLTEYFHVNHSDIDNLDQRELSSLNAIANEILEWEPDEDRKNIFLVDSYKESKRSTAAAYIAGRIYGEGRRIALVKTAKDLKRKNLKLIKGAETGYIFINYAEGGPISRKQMHKILLSIDKRRVRNVPVILSVPNTYSEQIRGEESTINVRYPQNSLSRAFVMLAISALVMPFFNFPFMQVPIGPGLAVNDAGAVSFLLFLYALGLILSSRKNTTWKSYVSISMAVALFIIPDLINLFSLQMLISTPLVSSYSIQSQIEYLNPVRYSANLMVYFPVIMKLASFAVLPLGFVLKYRRKYLYISYFLSLVCFYLAILALSLISFTSFYSPKIATFQYQYPPMAVYAIASGNAFLDALAGILPAVIFFSVYLSISADLKSRFSSPLTDNSGQAIEA